MHAFATEENSFSGRSNKRICNALSLNCWRAIGLFVLLNSSSSNKYCSIRRQHSLQTIFLWSTKGGYSLRLYLSIEYSTRSSSHGLVVPEAGIALPSRSNESKFGSSG